MATEKEGNGESGKRNNDGDKEGNGESSKSKINKLLNTLSLLFYVHV